MKKNTDSVNDDIFRKQREMELADEKLEQMINQAETRLSELFTSKLRDHEYKNPLEWYSKEEIELFIKENIREASSEYEMNIEKKLAKIYETKPEIVAKYFEFSDEWEENGLADLVRKLYKVDKYKEKLRG